MPAPAQAQAAHHRTQRGAIGSSSASAGAIERRASFGGDRHHNRAVQSQGSRRNAQPPREIKSWRWLSSRIFVHEDAQACTAQIREGWHRAAPHGCRAAGPRSPAIAVPRNGPGRPMDALRLARPARHPAAGVPGRRNWSQTAARPIAAPTIMGSFARITGGTGWSLRPHRLPITIPWAGGSITHTRGCQTSCSPRPGQPRCGRRWSTLRGPFHQGGELAGALAKHRTRSTAHSNSAIGSPSRRIGIGRPVRSW